MPLILHRLLSGLALLPLPGACYGIYLKILTTAHADPAYEWQSLRHWNAIMVVSMMAFAVGCAFPIFRKRSAG